MSRLPKETISDKQEGDQQQVLPFDDRCHVEDTSHHPYNSIGKIVAKIEVQIKGINKIVTAYGTATILSNNTVITAAHILNFKDFNKIASANDIMFYPAYQKYIQKYQPFQGIKVKQVHINPKFIQTQNKQSEPNDMVILILEQNNLISPYQFISIKWDYEFDKLKQSLIMIAGYSSDNQILQDFQDQNNNKLYFSERKTFPPMISMKIQSINLDINQFRILKEGFKSFLDLQLNIFIINLELIILQNQQKILDFQMLLELLQNP